eukprot:COSAG02_NODE_22076_length_764_cov_0.821053_1_plen_171_part_00
MKVRIRETELGRESNFIDFCGDVVDRPQQSKTSRTSWSCEWGDWISCEPTALASCRSASASFSSSSSWYQRRDIETLVTMDTITAVSSIIPESQPRHDIHGLQLLKQQLARVRHLRFPATQDPGQRQQLYRAKAISQLTWIFAIIAEDLQCWHQPLYPISPHVCEIVELF